MISTPDFPHTDKLKWVHVITVETDAHIQRWIDAVMSAGAKIEQGEEVVAGLRGQTSQKIAIIMGDTLDDRTIQENIDKYEALFADPTLSVRYFLFMRDWSTSYVEHDRVRTIPYMAFSPHDLIERMSRSLYKARLPYFLRTGYSVEICDELENIEGVNYRKIIIRSYVQRPDNRELEYESTDLYIHNKELYEIRDKKLIKLNDDSNVWVKKGNHTGPINISMLKDKNQTEE